MAAGSGGGGGVTGGGQSAGPATSGGTNRVNANSRTSINTGGGSRKAQDGALPPWVLPVGVGLTLLAMAGAAAAWASSRSK
jgi:hypothetical protein